MSRITKGPAAALLCVLAVSASIAQTAQHFPAPTTQTAISEDMAYSMILQAMALKENVLHAANLSPKDENTAIRVIGEFEFRFRELSAALDRGVLTPREFGEQRDRLARATRGNLRATLSHPGSIRLENYIRRQIVHIRVNTVQPTES